MFHSKSFHIIIDYKFYDRVESFNKHSLLKIFTFLY